MKSLDFLKKVILFTLLVIGKFAFAQNQTDTTFIKRELAFIYERDQRARKTDSAKFMAYIDSCNLAKVSQLIERHGWLGKSFVGNLGNYTIWLVVQHADLKTQEKYLPLLKASVSLHESRPVDLAYLEDRVLMRQGKKQIYGTQISFNSKTGAQELWPVEDEKNANARRKEFGMESLEEYLKHFGINKDPR